MYIAVDDCYLKDDHEIFVLFCILIQKNKDSNRQTDKNQDSKWSNRFDDDRFLFCFLVLTINEWTKQNKKKHRPWMIIIIIRFNFCYLYSNRFQFQFKIVYDWKKNSNAIVIRFLFLFYLFVISRLILILIRFSFFLYSSFVNHKSMMMMMIDSHWWWLSFEYFFFFFQMALRKWIGHYATSPFFVVLKKSTTSIDWFIYRIYKTGSKKKKTVKLILLSFSPQKTKPNKPTNSIFRINELIELAK